MTNLSIVVPTYNEAQNIEPLIQSIDAELNSLDREYEIVVVDDDSPDGSWERADRMASNFPVTAICRKNERGLSSAVVRGFQESQGEIIVVMDADFQHPPSYLPDLVKPIMEGDDFVVASRFVSGSEVIDFGWFRTLIANLANGIARMILKDIRPVQDVLAGFFAFRRDVLPAEYPKPFGYKILLTLLVHGHYDSVREIPFTFDKRRAGESKLGLKNVYWFLKHLARLYFSSGRKFAGQKSS